MANIGRKNNKAVDDLIIFSCAIT